MQLGVRVTRARVLAADEAHLLDPVKWADLRRPGRCYSVLQPQTRASDGHDPNVPGVTVDATALTDASGREPAQNSVHDAL
jgi:hypothetical protein